MKCCGNKNRKSQTDKYDAYRNDGGPDSCCDCTEAAQNCVRPDAPADPKLPYIWYPSRDEVKSEEYVRKLECEYACMQRSILTLTTHFARMQFRLRQILQATPPERYKLLRELERLAFNGLTDSDFGDEMPQIKHDLCALGEIRRKQTNVINKLRGQLIALSEASPLGNFEYKYSRECNMGDAKGGAGKNKKSARSSKSLKDSSSKDNSKNNSNSKISSKNNSNSKINSKSSSKESIKSTKK